VNSWDDGIQGPILHKLLDLVRVLNVTIISVDHFSKQDRKNGFVSINDVKGTGGKAQNADCVILLQRDGSNLRFFARSKDFGDQAFLLDVSPEGSGLSKYTYVSDLTSEARQKKVIDRQTRILEIVRESQSVTVPFISTKLKISPSTVQRDLKILVDKGLLDYEGEKKSRRYFINQSQEMMI
jgi:DNA-binding transcriptional ArsR family regulator